MECIKFGDATIQNSQEQKILRVLLDANLSFEKQISKNNDLCRKASNNLFALSRMSAKLDTDKLKLTVLLYGGYMAER